MFEIRDTYALRGGSAMEDRLGCGKDFAFVIDGATGLSDVHVTP